ncbi:MAG: cupin domain-containing protein [Halioglobus sp.]|nr:cupin domain-containing protein [Halioglobus sp.]
MSGRIRLLSQREEFLAQYWQRKPLYVPGALPDFSAPLSPDELAGLALDSDIESRLVDNSDGGWSVRHGPFEATDFQRPGPWTLLVQAVDHYLEPVTRLRDLVDFLPGWRIDDVMVSYATDGGSVGPHYDNYDVFLLQAKGRKQWRIGQTCDASSTLLPHDELRILAQFDTRHEYTLAPGDLLYVPPGVAHWGTALGDSMTLSIGFRAPRLGDVLSRCVDAALEEMDPDTFLTDAGRGAADGGAIDPDDLERAQRQVRRLLEQLPRSADWFGELLTEPRYELQPLDGSAEEELQALLAGAGPVVLEPAAKLAWLTGAQGITVYANGRSLVCDARVLPPLQALYRSRELQADGWGELLACADGRSLLHFLLEVGCIYVPRDTG